MEGKEPKRNHNGSSSLIVHLNYYYFFKCKNIEEEWNGRDENKGTKRRRNRVKF